MLASPGVTLLRWAQAPSPLAQGQHQAPAGSTQQTHDAGAPSQRTQSGGQVAVPPLLQPRFDPRVLRVCHHPGHRSRMTFRCPLFSGVNGLARHSCLKRSAPAVPAPTNSPGVPCLQPWGGHWTPPCLCRPQHHSLALTSLPSAGDAAEAPPTPRSSRHTSELQRRPTPSQSGTGQHWEESTIPSPQPPAPRSIPFGEGGSDHAQDSPLKTKL